MKKLHKVLLGFVVLLNLLTVIGLATAEAGSLAMEGFHSFHGPNHKSVPHHHKKMKCKHVGVQKVKPYKFRACNDHNKAHRIINLHNRNILLANNGSSGLIEEHPEDGKDSSSEEELRQLNPKFR